jgi:hypothetical protein
MLFVFRLEILTVMSVKLPVFWRVFFQATVPSAFILFLHEHRDSKFVQIIGTYLPNCIAYHLSKCRIFSRSSRKV